MKRKSIPALIVLVLVCVLVTVTTAAAAPRKLDFKATWWATDATGDPARVYFTPNGIHVWDGSWRFELRECTNPLVCGSLEWWEAPCSLSTSDQGSSGGCHGTFRINPYPDDPESYWEGNLVNVSRNPGSMEEFYATLAKMEGRGHGQLTGLLLKGEHWYEPTDIDNPLGLDPISIGEIIVTAKP